MDKKIMEKYLIDRENKKEVEKRYKLIGKMIGEIIGGEDGHINVEELGDRDLDIGENDLITGVVISIKDIVKLENEKLEKLLKVELLKPFRDLTLASKNMGPEIKIMDDYLNINFITGQREDIYPVFKALIRTNTFLELFNRILDKNKMERLELGIGVAASQRLETKYIGMDTSNKKILSIKDVKNKAKSLSLLANRDRNKTINTTYVVYENIIRNLIEELGDRVRNEFEEKFSISQGTYFTSQILDEDLLK